MAGLTIPQWQRPRTDPTLTQAPRTAAPPNTPNPAGFTPTQNNGAGPGAVNNNAGTPQPGMFSQTPGSAPVPGVTPTGVTWNVDPTGNATPYTPFANPGGETFWRPGESTNLYDQGMQRLMTLLKTFGMQGGPQDLLPREPTMPAPAREVPTTMADRTAAEAATFGRAKDRIGKLGGSALSTLRDRSSASGRAGSGLEARDERQIVEGMTSELGQVVRDQAIDSMDRADEIDDRNVGVGLTQRGQDIGIRAGDQAAGIQQRGQDYNAKLNPYQNPLMSSIPSLFGMFMPRTY